MRHITNSGTDKAMCYYKQDDERVVVWWGGKRKSDRSFYGCMNTPEDLIGSWAVCQPLATGVMSLNRWAYLG